MDWETKYPEEKVKKLLLFKYIPISVSSKEAFIALAPLKPYQSMHMHVTQLNLLYTDKIWKIGKFKQEDFEIVLLSLQAASFGVHFS